MAGIVLDDMALKMYNKRDILKNVY